MAKRRLRVVVARGVAAGAGALLALAAIVYFCFPERVLAAYVGLQARRAGMSARSVSLRGYRIPYYQGGAGPPLVLLHGFADDKMAFLQAARWLCERYTVYLPELAGHGETAHDPERKYGVSAQVQVLHELTEALGLRALSLGGNSLGGHVAAAFALAHPDVVQRLLLLDPAGLRVEGEPPLYQEEPSPMDTTAKYDAFMHRAFVRPPWLPGAIKRVFIQRSISRFTWLNRMLQDLRADRDYVLNDRLREIKAPTLIVWGAEDAILPLGHAALWHAGVSGSTQVVLRECGHAPQYEKPQQTAQVMRDFLEGRCTAQGCPPQ
ncbi:MAG: alpha/beta hydrolase [Polyangia bacterium]